MLRYMGILVLCWIVHSSAFASDFFKITATGPGVSPYSITLCLDGLGSTASCQNYSVSALNLSIKTTTPNHTYPSAGMQINTAGYTIAGCTPNSNGYCIFTVSNTTAYTATISPPYSVSGTISGLTASGLVLQNNGTDALSVSANATTFTILNAVGLGGSYNVTIETQPTRELCTVSNGSGTNATGDITNVSITCTAIPMAYITSDYLGMSTPPNLVQYCPLNVNGSFQPCDSNTTPDSGWNPYGVAFASLNSTPYAYVVSNRSPAAIYACGITPSTGAFTGAFGNPYCFAAYDPPHQPTGVTIATIGGVQYLYYVDNVQHDAGVCTISSTTGVLTCNTAIPNGTPQNNTGHDWNPYTLTIQSINGNPYAYVAAYADAEAYVCPINTDDGTFTNCINANGESGTWGPHGIAFATVNDTLYGYVASPNNHVYQCTLLTL